MLADSGPSVVCMAIDKPLSFWHLGFLTGEQGVSGLSPRFMQLGSVGGLTKWNRRWMGRMFPPLPALPSPPVFLASLALGPPSPSFGLPNFTFFIYSLLSSHPFPVLLPIPIDIHLNVFFKKKISYKKLQINRKTEKIDINFPCTYHPACTITHSWSILFHLYPPRLFHPNPILF